MKKLLISLLALVGLAGVGDLIYQGSSKPAVPTPAPGPTASPTAQATSTGAGVTAVPTGTPSPGSKYRDGTYSASGTYQSPGGQEKVGVSLTVTGGSITGVTVTPDAGNDPQGKQYEQRFAQGISSVVVGKPLDATFDVSQVNGSSLTGGGFLEALSAIRTQAGS